MVDLLTKFGAELTPEQKIEHASWLNPAEPIAATAQASHS